MNCENVHDYLGKFIGRGVQGRIHEHAVDKNKVIKVSNERPANQLMGPHIVINEWNLAKRAGELGVSPYVHNFLICIETTSDGVKYKGYIEMDKIEGKTLTTSDEVLKYFPMIIEKLEILKENNIAYHDFNPENIMIGYTHSSSSPEPQLYIIDYGGAKEMDSESIVIDEDELLEGLMFSVKGGGTYMDSIKPKKTPSPVKIIPSHEEQRLRALAWREKLTKKKGGNKTKHKSIFTKTKTYKNKSTKSNI